MVDYVWTDFFCLFLNITTTDYIYFKCYGVWAKAVP